MKIAILTQRKYRNESWFQKFVNQLVLEHHRAEAWTTHTRGFSWESYDLVISLLYDKIIKNNDFDKPRLGTINIHPSLLPVGRGSAPNFWAIVEDDCETGWTAHKMVAEVDRGPVLTQMTVPVYKNDTAESLWLRLFRVLPVFLEWVIDSISSESLMFQQIDYSGNRVHTLEMFHNMHNLNYIMSPLDGDVQYVLDLIRACSFGDYPGLVLETEDGKIEFKARRIE